MKISGHHDLQQLSHLLQKMIEQLHERNVHNVQWCSVYFEPLDASGDREVESVTNPAKGFILKRIAGERKKP